jgi:hypothetical protein
MRRTRNTNIRVGLRSHLLPCGCTVGIYETYRMEIVAVLDAKAPRCPEPTHLENQLLEGAWAATPVTDSRRRSA